MTKKKKLIPADPDRCQAEQISYHPFIMGGDTHQRERCMRQPVFIIKEKKKAKDGQRGSMSLCAKCFVAFVKQMPFKMEDYELIPIEWSDR